jgi:sugar lactone lactonase YvrE
MTTITNNRIPRLLGKLSLAAIALILLWTQPLHAQFVTTAISSNLFEPYGVTTDPSGNVYLTDSSNNRILEYSPTAGTVTTLAGLAGTANAGTNNGTGAAARFSQPLGIVYARGGLVVVDQNNQLIRYVTLSGTVSNLAGVTGVYGLNNGAANVAEFSFPTGIAVDNSGNLYIADQGNNAIRMISPANQVSTVQVGSYQFKLPSAVAVDGNSNVWVADTGNQVICMISNQVVTIMAGVSKVRGTNDSLIATQAEFDEPSGLLWVSSSGSMLISDTGNDTIRSLFLTNALGPEGYAVQTIAGIPLDPGEVNGSPLTAQFNGPIGLAVDVPDSGYYVVDHAGYALRVVQPTQPQPPVASPAIGYVTFPLVDGVPSATFNPITGTSVIFNNPADIAIQADPTAQTFMTYGPTPVNLLTNSIPTPGPNSGDSPPIFTAADVGLPQSEVPSSVVPTMPDLTLYAISEASGRQSSPVVSARIQFVTANPSIAGNNAAAVILSDSTANSEIYYTIDGTAPVVGATNTFGPIFPGATISFPVVTNVTLSAQAFATGFADSGIVTAEFSVTNFVSDDITFGFESGEASSEFIAAAGERFYAPVTLTLIPSAETIYSLQFNLAITNTSAPPVGPFTFQSMLEKPTNTVFVVIPPAMFSDGGFQSLLFTNDSSGLLGVGWVERLGATNLYNTLQQTLITYSQAHDTMFLSSGGKVVLGAFSFVVPPQATNGSQYEIQIGSPSATSDGISTPVAVDAVTNGALGQGAINSLKYVTVGSAQYLVGDVAPFRWFNAGDFGDGTLQNNDVLETFQSAIYGLNTPPPGSDYFDAMDSSDGSDNDLFDGNDTSINSIAYGDGYLMVDDVYVTYRRSLDPSLTWYNRYWTNGARTAVAVTNGLSKTFSVKPVSPTPHALSATTHAITVAADQVNSGGSLSVSVPIRVLAADTLPVRVFMVNVEIDPLDGSPAITNAITCSMSTNFGTAAMTSSTAPNNYGAAWLDSTVTGIAGTNIIGNVIVTLPPNVTTNSSYLVHFDHFSASPNGLALFKTTLTDGLITVGNRNGSSWHDGIPDSWRLLYFGTVSNMASAANLDPDGDGASNWAEFVAGTNPLDATSIFQFLPGTSTGPSAFTLQWPSIVNKTYTVQSSSTLSPGTWSTVASGVVGTGQVLQWTDTSPRGAGKFYRALVQ